MEAKYRNEGDGVVTTNRGRVEKKQTNKRCCIAVGVIVVLIIAAVIGIIVYFVEFHNKQPESVSQHSRFVDLMSSLSS